VNTGRAVVDASAARRAGATRPYLTVRDLGVRFGGVHAVDGFSMSAELGSITGLIGPNGAGKTTTLNACSGFVRPSGGLVEIDGTDLRRYGVAARARLGLGRTFQRGDLFDSLTVLENLIVAREAGLAGANPIAQVIGHRGDRDASHAAAFGAMQTTGITRFANVRAGVLSTGEKRLVELARVLTGSFDLLLLDEPSSGLHGAEVDRFGEVLVQVVAERGVGIVLVEHDMGLVRHVCDQVYVMDFGRLIFAGTVDEMLDSDAVRSAYLGSDAPHAVLRTDVARTLPGGGYG
jgi:ABC-type branched-subunit amino acid transport system ATPase component